MWRLQVRILPGSQKSFPLGRLFFVSRNSSLFDLKLFQGKSERNDQREVNLAGVTKKLSIRKAFFCFPQFEPVRPEALSRKE
jgi:hypothetical protein